MRPEFNEFAKQMVELVRDRAIRESSIDPSDSAKAEGLDAEGVHGFDVVIQDVVDVTIFSFLQAIDDGALRLEYITEGGFSLSLGEEGLGELSGYYMADWRAAFSTEAVSDD